MTRINNLRRLCWSLAIAATLLGATAASAAAAPGLRVTALRRTSSRRADGSPLYLTVQNTGTDPLVDALDGNLIVRYTFPPGVVPVDPFDFFTATVPPRLTTGQEVECALT